MKSDMRTGRVSLTAFAARSGDTEQPSHPCAGRDVSDEGGRAYGVAPWLTALSRGWIRIPRRHGEYLFL